MADTDKNTFEAQQTEETQPQVPQKKKCVISEEAKKVLLANPQKGRETRAKMKDVKKYPVQKRARAEEMNQELIDEAARKKAREILDQELEKKELEQLREWKKQQEMNKNETTSTKVSKSTKAKSNNSAPKKQRTVKDAARKSTRGKTKGQPVSENQEQEQFLSHLKNDHNPYAAYGFNIDDILD